MKLTIRVLGSEVDGGTDPCGSKVEGPIHRTEHHLVIRGGVGEQLVVVDFYDERDLVCVLPGYRSEDAEGRGNTIAAAGNGEFDNVLGSHIRRIGGKRRRRGVLDALVDGQHRQIPGTAEPAMRVERLKVPQHRYGAIGLREDAVDVVGPGKSQVFLRYPLRLMRQKVLCFVAEKPLEVHKVSFRMPDPGIPLSHQSDPGHHTESRKAVREPDVLESTRFSPSEPYGQPKPR